MKSKNKSFFRPATATAFAAMWVVFSGTASAQNWDGGDTANGSWAAANNWNPNTAPAFLNTTDLVFNNTTRAITNSYYGGNTRLVRSLTFGANIDGTWTTDTTTGSILQFSSSTGTSSLTIDTDATANISFLGGTGFTGFQRLNNQLEINHNGTGVLLWNRQTDGVGGFTKSGRGTFKIAGFNGNSFTGAVNVNQGRMIFGNTSGATNDFNTASAVNLGGGVLEIETTTAFNKVINPNITVSAASTLAFNNTATTDQSLTVQTGTMVLNSNLTLQNMSNVGTNNNVINVTRNITGSGTLIVDTTNNVASGAVDFSRGRVQLSGNNTGWTGSLVVAKGTAQFSGNNSFVPAAGSITLGITGNSFGAALGFNQGNTDSNITNAITVTTGGVRLIRNNSGPGTTANVTLSGAIDLQGSLTLDHAGLGADKSITVSGIASGAGGLNVSFVGPHQVASSSVRLTGANDYTGATNVSSGTLVINGSTAAGSAVSVAAGTVTGVPVATIGGKGTIGGTLSLAGESSAGFKNGGVLSPGETLGDIQTLKAGTTTWNGGGIWDFDLSSVNTTSDKLDITGNLVKGTGSGFEFDFMGSTPAWNTTYTLAQWSNIVTGFVTSDFSFSNLGGGPYSTSFFTLNSNSLTFTAVPEPSSALVGLLVGAGLLRRRRA